MEFGISKWSSICELKKLGLRSRLAEFTALGTVEGFMTQIQVRHNLKWQQGCKTLLEHYNEKDCLDENGEIAHKLINQKDIIKQNQKNACLLRY